MEFNAPGPVQVKLEAHLDFHEDLSARSQLVVVLFVFGVVLTPEETVAGLPQPTAS